MTQFSTPRRPEIGSALPRDTYAEGTPPWSASAVAAFVLSLLGCAAIPAIFGLILSIVGIRATRDGRRRGRGLAIAAIPISIITGIGSLGLGVFGYASFALARYTKTLPNVLSADAPSPEQAISILRNTATSDFNESVSDERLVSWLQAVLQTDGRLIALGSVKPVKSTGVANFWTVQFAGKFVNGLRTIELDLATSDWTFHLNDIRIAGKSPRDAE
jgi:hypothetical protein